MTAKSYTQVSSYEKCPKQYSFRYVERIKVDRVKSPAAERGTIIHQSIEDYMNGKATHVHPEIASYEEWLGDLKKDGAKSELSFCLNDMWEPVDWNSPEGYIRGYIDLIYDDYAGDGLILYEFKTGKKYDDHPIQGHLYSVAARILYSRTVINVITVYLDLKENVEIDYKGSYSVDKYLWSARIDKLDADPYYAPRPGPYCNWCDYAKSKGGPCQYGG